MRLDPVSGLADFQPPGWSEPTVDHPGAPEERLRFAWVPGLLCGTGKYRFGTDKVIVDASGRSAISYEDFAAAMIDEIEKPQYINKHFTAGY
jgi:hypothetical protein